VNPGTTAALTHVRPGKSKGRPKSDEPESDSDSDVHRRTRVGTKERQDKEIAKFREEQNAMLEAAMQGQNKARRPTKKEKATSIGRQRSLSDSLSSSDETDLAFEEEEDPWADLELYDRFVSTIEEWNPLQTPRQPLPRGAKGVKFRVIMDPKNQPAHGVLRPQEFTKKHQEFRRIMDKHSDMELHPESSQLGKVMSKLFSRSRHISTMKITRPRESAAELERFVTAWVRRQYAHHPPKIIWIDR
jgi:hypothetical protein